MKIYIQKRFNSVVYYFDVRAENSSTMFFVKSFETEKEAEIFANGALAGMSLFIPANDPIKIIREDFTSTDK